MSDTPAPAAMVHSGRDVAGEPGSWLGRVPLWVFWLLCPGLIVAVGLMALILPIARERIAIRELQAIEGVGVDGMLDLDQTLSPTAESISDFLTEWVGEGYWPALVYSVDIHGNPKRALSLLSSIRRVESVVVYSDELDDADLVKLQSLRELDWLQIDSQRITPAGIRHIRGLPVAHVYLHDAATNNDHLAAVLETFPTITSLGFEETSVDDEGLKLLRGHPTLELLDLTATQVTDRGLKHLATLPKLEGVWLKNTAVTDEGSLVIGSVSSLYHMDLTGTRITDLTLSRLPAGKYFSDVNVSNTGVTDDGVRSIRANLHSLNVSQTKVRLDRATVDWINSQPNLKQITAVGNDLSPEGVELIRAKGRTAVDEKGFGLGCF
jgi:hypothetical protein